MWKLHVAYASIIFFFFLIVSDVRYHFGNFSVSAFFNLFIMFWPFFKKNDADIGLRRQKSMVWAQTICDQELGSRGIFRFSALKKKY